MPAGPRGRGPRQSDAATDGAALDEAARAVAKRLLLRGFKRDDVEDAVQEAVTAVLSRGARRIYELRGYLYVSARRHLWRVGGGIPSLSLDSVGEEGLYDTAASAETLATQTELAEKVRASIKRLPDSDRVVLHLRMEGLSYVEIARRLGVTEGSLRVRTHRALKALRDLLKYS